MGLVGLDDHDVGDGNDGGGGNIIIISIRDGFYSRMPFLTPTSVIGCGPSHWFQ